MKVNTNIASLYANLQLRRTEDKLSKVSEQLVSGYKLNHASDGPSEYAMANKINSQIMGLNQASSNVTDAQSITNIVDGVLSEITDMIQRLNELAVQSSTDGYTDEDRKSIDAESNQILKEIESLSKSTQFNKQNLIDGSFDLKGYTNNKNVSVKYYSDDVKFGIYDMNFNDILSMENDNIKVNLDKVKETFPNVTNAKFENDELVLTGTNGFELTMKMKNLPESKEEQVSFVNSLGKIETNLSGYGAMKIQTGSNQGQTISMRIPNMSLDNIGLSKVDLSTPEKALDSIKSLEKSLSYVTSARSLMGAYSNRLEHHSQTLAYEIDNLTSSYANIMDADIATTMSEYSNLQVLQQANISVLKQINDNASIALQLLS